MLWRISFYVAATQRGSSGYTQSNTSLSPCPITHYRTALQAPHLALVFLWSSDVTPPLNSGVDAGFALLPVLTLQSRNPPVSYTSTFSLDAPALSRLCGQPLYWDLQCFHTATLSSRRKALGCFSHPSATILLNQHEHVHLTRPVNRAWGYEVLKSWSWNCNIVSFLFISVFDQLDLVTYEEVVKLPAFKRKTLVLLGMYGSVCSVFFLRTRVLSGCWQVFLFALYRVQELTVLAEDTSRTHSSLNTPTDLLTPFHVRHPDIVTTL